MFAVLPMALMAKSGSFAERAFSMPWSQVSLPRRNCSFSTSTFQPFILSTCQPFINLSTFQLFHPWTSQPLNLSADQPFNLSTLQPVNLSTSETLNLNLIDGYDELTWHCSMTIASSWILQKTFTMEQNNWHSCCFVAQPFSSWAKNPLSPNRASSVLVRAFFI